MPQKSYKPITPGTRFRTNPDFSGLTPKKKLPKRSKKLIKGIERKTGRNNFGNITSFQRGGGHKQLYRMVDFMRAKHEIPAKVASIEYDPNRTARIAQLNYADGEKTFILAPVNLKVGDSVIASEQADILPGNNLSLSSIPVGTLIHNVEIEPGKGGKLARSAGCYAQLLAKDGELCHVKMTSGEIRLLNSRCRASIGQLSNVDHENMTIGKAGRSRWLGRRPHTRGVAMNPIDHPMGGGEGKASGGHPRSPWGQPAKGYKTRSNKRTDAFIVKRRK